MRKSTLAILLLSGLLFAACDDDSKADSETQGTETGEKTDGDKTDGDKTDGDKTDGDKTDGCKNGDNRCAEDGMSTETCSNGSWTLGINCSYGCSDGNCTKKKVCDEGAVRCADGDYAVEKCEDNAWVKASDCEYKCSTKSGTATCVEKVCDEGAVQCKADSDAVPQKCVDNEWVDEAACDYKCVNGGCIEKVCDEGTAKCSEDGTKQIVCNNNIEEETACSDGCSDGKCKDHVCDENSTRCSADSASVVACKNNTWTLDYVCGTNEECSSKANGCACKPGMTRCDGVCTDLLTDANNCGSCGNKVGSCAGGQACVSNNNFIAPYSKNTVCCDPEAKKYVYLDHALNCDDGDKFVKFNDWYGYSLHYCMTDADVKAVPNYTKCIVSADDMGNLNDAKNCGINSTNTKTCTLTATTSSKKNATVCDAGRCCFDPDDSLPVDGAGPGASTSYNETHTFSKNDCCSKIAYKKSSAGGTWYYCTYEADYYKQACSTCPSGNKCEVDESKKSCSIRNSGTGISITML